MADRSKKPRQNTVFGGMAILAVGIAAVKVIGALFKIPLFNILGETGTADFNNAYNIYAVLLTVSTAGLPVALSKTVAEASALGRHNQERRVFRVALAAFLTMGVLSFLVMWLGSARLAALLHNTHAAPGIRALAPAVVCVGCLSAFRGYAQGHLDMAPTSVSQIIEALCKLFLGLGLALLIMRGSLLSVASEERTSYAAAGAITGVTVGTALALGYMALDYTRKRRRFPRGTDTPDGAGTILKNLMRIAIPITLSTTMVPVINVLDNALVQGRLQNALGMTETASRALYGNYSVAANLHNLPGSFMTALTAAIIPAVAACLAHRDRDGASRMIGSVLRLTALLAMPMGVGLAVLSGPIVGVLFRDTHPMGPTILSWLGKAGSLTSRCLEVHISQSTTSALEQAHHLSVLGNITQELSCLGIIDRSSARHLNYSVLTLLAGALIFGTWGTVGSKDVTRKLKVYKSPQIAVATQENVTSSSAITPIGTTFWNIFCPVQMFRTGTSVPTAAQYLYIVNEVALSHNTLCFLVSACKVSASRENYKIKGEVFVS